MTRESLLYKILSGIHIVFFSSLLCFGTIFLSGTILLLPALGAAFLIGKEAIYKDLDINNSIVKSYFTYLKSSLSLIKFLPINLMIALNIAGMLLLGKRENIIYSVICLMITAFLLAFLLYTAGYYTFVNPKVNLQEVAIGMFLKPQLFIPVFIIMVLGVAFFSGILLVLLLLSGAFFLFVLEVLIFIGLLSFKKLAGTLDEKEEYAYLVNRK